MLGPVLAQSSPPLCLLTHTHSFTLSSHPFIPPLGERESQSKAQHSEVGERHGNIQNSSSPHHPEYPGGRGLPGAEQGTPVPNRLRH